MIFKFLSIVFSIILSAGWMKSFCQKPNFDTTNIRKWQGVWGPSINSSGKFVSYFLFNKQSGTNSIIIKAVDSNWEKEFPNISDAFFTGKGNWIVFLSKNDILRLVKLGEDSSVSFSRVQDFKINPNRSTNILAFREKDTHSMIVLDLDRRNQCNFDSVSEYTYSPTGKNLAIQKSFRFGYSDEILLHNFETNKTTSIWKFSSENCQAGKTSALTFIPKSNNFLFLFSGERFKESFRKIYLYKEFQGLSLYFNDKLLRQKNGFFLVDKNLIVSETGNRVLFWINKVDEFQKQNMGNEVRIWKTFDTAISPFVNYGELESKLRERQSNLLATLNDSILTTLSNEGEQVFLPEKPETLDAILVRYCRGDKRESNWNPTGLSSFYLVQTKDATRRIFIDSISNEPFYPRFSPTGKWILSYNKKLRNYVSYEVSSGKIRNITQEIKTSWKDIRNDKEVELLTWYPSRNSWLKNDKLVLMTDNYDIWLVDPLASRKPLCITNRFGKRKHIKFNIAVEAEDLNELEEKNIPEIVLSAFNTLTKESGFSLALSASFMDPKTLCMGPYRYSLPGLYSYPLKAAENNRYLVRRMSDKEAPNIFITEDLVNFRPLSDIQPQRAFNWLSANLINWKERNGKRHQGILYKPENFDSTKKYPIIFNFYERITDNMYQFLAPDFTDANINIPWFTSRGYLVFQPDMEYKIGQAGEDALNTVVSAVDYLKKNKWVNIKAIGIQGHSWGGYQVNYIVSKTSYFTAAAEFAGETDLISGYNLLSHGGTSRTWIYEQFQMHLGGSPWEQPLRYKENSPILRCNFVKTPILIVHNQLDDNVPFSEGLEWFNCLRRNKKTAWLLQYPNSKHVLSPKDSKDYTLRLTSYFDYYLKSSAKPSWLN